LALVLGFAVVALKGYHRSWAGGGLGWVVALGVPPPAQEL
jgi:hypothetical protein